MAKPGPVPEHILDRMSRKFLVGDGCWEWTGSRSDGYGRIKNGREAPRAHIVLYEIMVGPVPEGLLLDHLCRNRACVRPGHLEPVTPAENIRRGEGSPAQNGRKTHCDHGHPFDAANTVIRNRPGGKTSRTCRTCNRAWAAAAREKGDVAIADAATNRFKYALGHGDAVPGTADYRMGLLGTMAGVTNVPDINFITDMEAHADFAELTGASGYTRVALTTETITEVDASDWALIDCDDVSFGALGTGATIVGYFIYNEAGGTDGTRAVYQIGSLTSTPTNGGTVTVTTGSGITKLV